VPAKVSFDVTHLIESMISFFSISSTLSLLHCTHFHNGARPHAVRKTGFIVFIMCSLLTMALAATDCEILNSGISSISSTACCTETKGIVCVNGRVTEMYLFYVFNSVSELNDAVGHLPFEIGNLTELASLYGTNSDLSAGPVPESIGLCIKITYLVLRNSKLKGTFPTKFSVCLLCVIK
jgi:hypothetical protein